MSREVDECKPLLHGPRAAGAGGARVLGRRGGLPRPEARGRGLHSSTCRLNVSALHWIGSAFRCCVGGV